MGDHHGRLSYHLVFASQHPLGLEKMKEAMESVDKSGSYSFSDATAGESLLPFNFKDPAPAARKMQTALGGAARPYTDFHDYALTETPFRNPKQMLEHLKAQGQVEVVWNVAAPPKRGFPEEKITSILVQREANQLF